MNKTIEDVRTSVFGDMYLRKTQFRSKMGWQSEEPNPDQPVMIHIMVYTQQKNTIKWKGKIW